MQKTLKEITRDELFAEFVEPEENDVPPETRQSLENLLAREDVDGMVLYVNIQMDSSSFGRKQAMVFGPGCTFKDVATCPPHLNDLPSQRQYPQAVYKKE